MPACHDLVAAAPGDRRGGTPGPGGCAHARNRRGGRAGGRRVRRRPAAPHRHPLRALRRRRAPARVAGGGVAARPGRARGVERPPQPRDRCPDRDRHHLPHLLDDQADHLGGRDDAVRGGRLRAEGPPAPLHRVVPRPARVPQRVGHGSRHRAGHRADPHLAPAHPHVRAHLRLPARPPRRRDVPRGRVRVGRTRGCRPGRLLRRLGVAAAAVRARHRVELLGVHRRARPARRGGVRHAARRLPAGARLRAARHDRDRVPRRRRRPRPARGALHRRSGAQGGAVRGHGPRRARSPRRCCRAAEDWCRPRTTTTASRSSS